MIHKYHIVRSLFLLKDNFILSFFPQIQFPKILPYLIVMKQEVLIIPRTLPQEAAALGLLWLGAQASGPEEMARIGMQCPLGEQCLWGNEKCWLTCVCEFQKEILIFLSFFFLFLKHEHRYRPCVKTWLRTFFDRDPQ